MRAWLATHPRIAIASGVAFLALLGGIAWSVSVIRRLDREVTRRFSGRRWEIPSKIYSDSYVVYAGADVPPLELVGRLGRLDYRRIESAVEHAGEYSYDARAGRLEVFLRSFDYPNRRFEGFPARVDFENGRISRITHLDSAGTIDSLELEPETLAGIYEQVWEERRVVHLNEIPKILVQAVLAAEDRRFFQHHGVDLRGVFRATVANLRHGRVVQGGSTLTQQLVKNFFLTESRTFKRKVTEVVMSLLLELHYSKLEILEAYLNEIYLGQRGARGIFGVWEGAEFYFGKEPKDLSVGEAATLAGLIRSPGRLAPAKNPEPARRRRDEVLRALRAGGDLTESEYEQALAEPLPERLPIARGTFAPYFVDFVRAELESEYSDSALATEGFRVFTTLDPALQSEAEAAVDRGLAALEKRHPALARGPERLEACLLAIQPRTGEIKAMVGGRSYELSQFNRVTDAERQPGSVFKPIVFLAALETEEQQGGGRFLPTRGLVDAPFTWTYDGRSWSPENYRHEYRGDVTLRQALELSLNSATARLAEEVGLEKIRDMAVRLGFPESLPALPSIVLGGVEVRPTEVAEAFATIANLGFRTENNAIRAVLDGEGNTLARSTPGASQVVSPRVAYLATTLMEGVVDRGTAQAVRAAGIRFPVAGKTGTTNEGRDAWFVGFSPDLLAVAWVGFDREQALGLSGAQAALPIWTDFMKAATAARQPVAFLVPPGIDTVTIDPLSGELATARCPERLDESFFAGEAPTVPCHLHPPFVAAPLASPPPSGSATFGSRLGARP